MSPTLHICMLNADVPVPAVFKNRAPTYGKIFHDLLSAAAFRTSLDVKVTSTDFDVVNGEYPASLANFNAIIISGSANSAYDDVDWVLKLDAYILDVYRNEPRVKIFGSCFGHQLMCQSLLRDHGVRVEADPKGWEIGVKEIALNDAFKKVFGEGDGKELLFGSLPEKLRLQFVHHDHVVIPAPSSLPPLWITLGSTEHCAVQGVYEPGRILTLQGHFEFDRFVNSETIKVFFARWSPSVLEETLSAMDADDDSVEAAAMVLRFFMEKGADERGATSTVTGGLLTPPLQ